MFCTREQVHGGGLGEGTAPGGEQLYVPGQGGWVAGDVDDALGGHLDPGVGALGGEPHGNHQLG